MNKKANEKKGLKTSMEMLTSYYQGLEPLERVKSITETLHELEKKYELETGKPFSSCPTFNRRTPTHDAPKGKDKND